jgi:hypothetical protein
MQEALEKYMEQNRMYHLEGGMGVRAMKKIMKEVCGYSNDWMGTLENFFADNPGAVQAVVEWIGEQNNTEWTSNLAAMVENDESEVAEC